VSDGAQGLSAESTSPWTLFGLSKKAQGLALAVSDRPKRLPVVFHHERERD
jgi:hypothetical protein